MTGRQFADGVDHHGSVHTGVGGDPVQRGRQRVGEDVHPERLVTGERVAQLLQRAARLNQCATAARDDALLDRRLRRGYGVLDPVLAFLERGLGGGADLDHRDTAGQLGQPLLQFLAVPVRIAGLDLALELLDPVGNGVVGAATVDDHACVLADHHATCGAQNVQPHLAQQQPDIGVDHLCAGDDRQILQEGLAAVTEERRLDRDGAQRLADRVDHQSAQRLALDVLGDDQQRLTCLGHLLQQWQQIGQRADLVAVQQHQGVLEHRLL